MTTNQAVTQASDRPDTVTLTDLHTGEQHTINRAGEHAKALRHMRELDAEEASDLPSDWGCNCGICDVCSGAAPTEGAKVDVDGEIYLVRPCPRCGFPSPRLKTTHGRDAEWLIGCVNNGWGCDFSGPMKARPEWAISAWNQLARPAKSTCDRPRLVERLRETYTYSDGQAVWQMSINRDGPEAATHITALEARLAQQEAAMREAVEAFKRIDDVLWSASGKKPKREAQVFVDAACEIERIVRATLTTLLSKGEQS